MGQAAPNLIRAVNDRAALQALADRGPLTRPEIGALLGLSKPTASQLLSRLQGAGLVIPEGIREGGPGRAAEVYRINPDIAHVACFDATPGMIDAVIADVTGTVKGSFCFNPPEDKSVAGALDAALEGACRQAGLDRTSIHSAVIGVQGALNPVTGRLGFAAHLPEWQIPAVAKTLRETLGVPVAIENDVNLVALAERAHGAARAHRNFVLLWAADGLGMALFLNGELYRGFTGGAGEIGYIPVPGAPIPQVSDRPANYGFHALAGGPAVLKLLRQHGFRGATPTAAMKAASRAWDAPATETAQRAHDAFSELASRIALGLAGVVGVIDPEVVILAGSVLSIGAEPLRALIQERLHTMTIPTPPVLLSALQGNPVLSGAINRAVHDARDDLFSVGRK